MPSVAVILPTFNRKFLVCEAIESVLLQTFTNFRLVIIDDGSTDGTHTLLEKFSDPRIRVIRQRNMGQGAARNTGIKSVDSEYYAFLDSDDIWLPSKLEEQLEAMNKNCSMLWSYTDAYAFDHRSKQKLYIFSQNGKQKEGMIARALIMGNFVPTSTVIVHHSVIEDVGFFSNAPKAQDWELWLRIAAKYPVCRINQVLVGYRIHPNMVSKRLDTYSIHRHHTNLIKKVADSFPIYRSLKKRALSNQNVKTGNLLASQGNLGQARRMYFQALLFNPFQKSAYPRILATFLGRDFVTKWIDRNRGKRQLKDDR